MIQAAPAPAPPGALAAEVKDLLAGLGVDPDRIRDGTLTVCSPITGETIARVHPASAAGGHRPGAGRL